jgi:hypothetical protein
MEQGTSSERFALDFHGGNPTSSQLALAARRGDRVAFLELVHTYDVMVMRVALTLTASEPTALQSRRIFRHNRVYRCWPPVRETAIQPG